MTQFLNIAGYKFITLSDLPDLRDKMLACVSALELKGTILLSTEGINLNLTGTPVNMGDFLDYLKQDPRFADMTFRESYSLTPSFKRLKVKIKKEIITLRKENIDPEKQAAPALNPEDLKQWLDEGRDITLLDTRNEYEVRFGTFENAQDLKLKDFCEFPVAAKKLERNKPIVMFCTGGIRCEKASAVLVDEGFKEVYQLQGGILNYFAKVGGAHYNGECFVFDQRVAVNPSLEVSGTLQCISCQGPIRDQSDCVQCVHPI